MRLSVSVFVVFSVSFSVGPSPDAGFDARRVGLSSCGVLVSKTFTVMVV